MKVFLASSFAYLDPEISAMRKAKMEEALAILTAQGHTVFAPHHHMVERAWDISNREWGCKVAKMDKDEICSSDAVVLLTYGKEKNNAGVSFESGYIAGINQYRELLGQKPIILVLVKMNDEVESLMMWSSAHIEVRGLEGLKELDFSNPTTLDDVVVS